MLPDVVSVQPWADLSFIAAADAEDCVAKVLQLVTEFVPQKLRVARSRRRRAGARADAQGPGRGLQPQPAPAGGANPDRSAVATFRAGAAGGFRSGDKVIQLRNNYDKNLFNGDIGTITAVQADAGTFDADFDGERHQFTRGESGDLALAYAISIHKSQGSEYPVVIVPLLKAHFMMLQRNLLYTAVTRGRKKVFIVGEPAAYAMAVRNHESRQRVTHLREKLLG